MEWPAPVWNHLQTVGAVRAVDHLSGMSGAGVWRVRVAGNSLIVKASRSSREFDFYRSVAGPLGEIGVATPTLHWSGRHGDSYWLFLEDVSEPLPQPDGETWRVDFRVLETLRRLHNAPLALCDAIPAVHEHSWTREMNASALECFPRDTANALAPPLETLRREAQRLFEPRCLISGDPNPRNWGVRAGGVAVLFDWERLGRGSPAIDLAIAIPGLGNREMYQVQADDYNAVQLDRDHTPLPVASLVREIALAKAWSVVELMANFADGSSAIDAGIIDWLIKAVPTWITAIAEPI